MRKAEGRLKPAAKGVALQEPVVVPREVRGMAVAREVAPVVAVVREALEVVMAAAGAAVAEEAAVADAERVNWDRSFASVGFHSQAQSAKGVISEDNRWQVS